MAVQLKFAAPARSRERIILFGMEGVGKTKAAIQVIEKSIGGVWIIETDNTYDEFLESYPHIGARVKEEYVGQVKDDSYYNNPDGDIHLLRVRNWKDYVWAMEYAFKNAERDDWIIIDNVTNMWDEVQSWYVTEAYGKSPGDFAVEVRKKQIGSGGDKKATVAQELFTDWGAINPQYFENVKKWISSPPCHLIMIAEQAKIGEKEDKETRATFGPYGVKPKGQKSLGHTSRTVILLTKDSRFGQETYMTTTCKDREREKLDGVGWGNFMDDYLRKIGKWKAVRVEMPERAAE